MTRRPVRLGVAGLLAVAVTAPACGEGDAPAPISVADSAGITVVTNTPDHIGRLPEIRLARAQPIVPSEGPDHALHQVTQIVSIPDGRLAVLNAGSNEVMLFSMEGELLAGIGRVGDGPGELRAPNSLLGIGADSVGVYDMRHQRLSVFHVSGELGRELSLRDRMPDVGFAELLPVAGGMILRTHGRPVGQGVFRPESVWLRLTLEGEPRAEYGPFPGTEVFQGQFGGFVGGMVLFGATTHATTFDEELYVATADAPEVRVYASDGSLSRIHRWPDEDRDLTDERAERELLRLAATMSVEERAGFEQVMEHVPRSEEVPALRDIVMSQHRELWVGDYPGPGASLPSSAPPVRSWLVLDADGATVARARTPAGFRLHLVWPAALIGVQVDALGRESVVRHPLIR